ncbi:MAG TPA: hypothetical protein DEQ28_05155, partial [Clostridiales bacterium]|nr:hypothetical protein [Clostridiales bacterium]
MGFHLPRAGPGMDGTGFQPPRGRSARPAGSPTEGVRSMTLSATAELLRVEELTVVYETGRGTVRAVNGVSLQVDRGEVLALVGESGCGKSTVALAIMRLVPPPGEIAGGRIGLEGRDLLGLGDAALAGIRGKRIAMIFQNPL